MHSCQHLRLNCNQPAEPWSNNLCQSAILRFLTANSSMHRTELHLWQTLCGTIFKSLHAEFHEKQFGFMKNTHDSQGDCVFRPVQEVSAAAFRPFLVSVWFHVNQFKREEPAWFHRRADTPPSPWTGPNQPENVDNVGSAWLQGDKQEI